MNALLPWIGGITSLIACFLAMRMGGRDEAYGALIFLIGSLTTLGYVLLFGATWAKPEIGLLVIDLIMMLAFIHLALISDRFWPMWIAGFHLVSLAVYAASFVAINVIPWVFATGVVFWAWPTKLTLIIAIYEYRAQKEHGRLGKMPLTR
jgi:hypothetical protein